jgi:hypothetical protein
MRVVMLSVALLSSLVVAPRANADEPCVDASRECVIATAMTYLDALISHDVSGVRLAPDVWRMNNGHVAARGEDEVRSAIRVEPVAAIHSLRWVVEGEDAVAVYDLDADFTRSVQTTTFAPVSIPAYIAERFKVRDGLIHEIEVVYWGDPTLSPRPARPFRPASFPSGPCADGSRACAIETAGAYVAALASHDASAVPLAPDAWRLENGRNTGDDGESIRAAVESPVMDVIVAITDVRWFVEDDHAVAYYVLYAEPGPLVGTHVPEPLLTPAYIAERFRIQDGLIKEIEAVFWIDPPGSRPDPRPGG